MLRPVLGARDKVMTQTDEAPAVMGCILVQGEGNT